MKLKNGIILSIILIFLGANFLYSEELKERVSDKFLRYIVEKKCDKAESLLSYDADANLRLNIINDSELNKNIEGFKKLKFIKELKFKNEKIELYRVRKSKELLAFIIVKRKNKYKILNFIPVETSSVFNFKVIPKNRRKINEIAEKIKKRISNYNFAAVNIEKDNGTLLVTTLGIKNVKLIIALLKIRGKFSIRKIEKHSCYKYKYFPMIGIDKKSPEYVSYHDIANDRSVKKVIRDRDSFGVSEIKIIFNAGGKLNLIRFYRNYKNRKNRINIAAILDNYIIKRVKLRKSFLTGKLWIENIPNPDDARLLSSIIGTSYPCEVKVTFIKK